MLIVPGVDFALVWLCCQESTRLPPLSHFQYYSYWENPLKSDNDPKLITTPDHLRVRIFLTTAFILIVKYFHISPCETWIIICSQMQYFLTLIPKVNSNLSAINVKETLQAMDII